MSYVEDTKSKKTLIRHQLQYVPMHTKLWWPQNNFRALKQFVFAPRSSPPFLPFPTRFWTVFNKSLSSLRWFDSSSFWGFLLQMARMVHLGNSFGESSLPKAFSKWKLICAEKISKRVVREVITHKSIIGRARSKGVGFRVYPFSLTLSFDIFVRPPLFCWFWILPW